MSKSEKPLEMKWSWNSATQNRIPCLEDVHAKPGRDIVIISRLHGLPGIEFYEGDWWWFSLNFKAPTNPVVCFKRYKIDPQRWMQLIFQNHRWERNQQDLHHSASNNKRIIIITSSNHRLESAGLKALEALLFKMLGIEKMVMARFILETDHPSRTSLGKER